MKNKDLNKVPHERCNCCECIWLRVLYYSNNNNQKPSNKEEIFRTKKDIEFWIEKINDETILPHNSKHSHLYKIEKKHICKDINDNLGGAGGNVNVFGVPAPSYRYALLNDDRIWIK